MTHHVRNPRPDWPILVLRLIRDICVGLLLGAIAAVLLYIALGRQEALDKMMGTYGQVTTCDEMPVEMRVGIC